MVSSTLEELAGTLRVAIEEAEQWRKKNDAAEGTLTAIEEIYDESLSLVVAEIGWHQLQELLQEETVSNLIQTIAVALLGLARILHVAANQVVPPDDRLIAKATDLYQKIPLDKVPSRTITDDPIFWPLEILQDRISTARKKGAVQEEEQLLHEALAGAATRLGVFQERGQVPDQKEEELLAVRSAYAVLLARLADKTKELQGFAQARQILASQLGIYPNYDRLNDLKEMGAKRALDLVYAGPLFMRAALLARGLPVVLSRQLQRIRK